MDNFSFSLGKEKAKAWLSSAHTDIIITIMRRGRYFKVLVMGMGIALLVLALAPAGASSANISHSYHADSQLPNGALVSLDQQRSDYVQLADTGNGSRLLGVAVDSNDSLLAVNATPGSVQVATSGNASVLVSNVNGDIKVGDQIAVSPFSGIGMKAQPGLRVIGLAQTAFSSKSSGAESREVTDKAGHKTSVAVGYASITIAVGTDGTGATENLTTLQRFGKSITGHVVSTQRVAISIAVAVITLFALITLIYASIYGSIISVGRNPLAKYTVFRTLGSVFSLALLATVISGVTIFFLLR